MLPLALIKKKITNQFFKSFLYYIPYTVLAAMTFPAIFYSTGSVLSASAGFGLLLAGGIVYSVGAVLYGIGSKIRWMHSVFHIFVVLGSVQQFLAIFVYAL